MTIVSVDEGLYGLPAVFHSADLTIRLGWKPRLAMRNLHIWQARGHAAALGGRSGVYANLIAARYPNWELALRVIMPTAMVIGVEILRRAGWTTQIQWAPTVAVSSAQRAYTVKNFTVELLPPEWFEQIKPGVLSGEGVALSHLTPAWALADMIKREGWCDCGLGPDDIYWEMVTEQDLIAWRAACTALGVDETAINPDASAIRAPGRY